jgi:hypothetical protein
MTRDELDALWSEPTHWTAAGFYRCPADPRVVVLKRHGGGWTVNAAHRRAWLVLAAVVAVALAPLAVKLALGPRAPGWLFAATLLIPIAAAVASTAWVSHRDR